VASLWKKFHENSDHNGEAAMEFFQTVGIFMTISALIYILLFIAYKIKKPNAEPSIDKESMPKLLPVPIPTAKHETWLPKILTWMFNIRKWELTENWRYQLNEKDEIIIPKGFEFDGASIPRPLWGILSPVGLLLIPGLIHDFGYRHNQLWKIDKEGEIIPFQKNSGRPYWDDLLFKVSLKINGLVLINLLAWIALTFGGSYTWEKRRKNHVEPEKPYIEDK
jgi:hypothetical protein